MAHSTYFTLLSPFIPLLSLPAGVKLFVMAIAYDSSAWSLLSTWPLSVFSAVFSQDLVVLAGRRLRLVLSTVMLRLTLPRYSGSRQTCELIGPVAVAITVTTMTNDGFQLQQSVQGTGDSGYRCDDLLAPCLTYDPFNLYLYQYMKMQKYKKISCVCLQGCSSPIVVKFADTQKDKEQKRMAQQLQQQMQQLSAASMWGNLTGLNSLGPQYLAVSVCLQGLFVRLCKKLNAKDQPLDKAIAPI